MPLPAHVLSLPTSFARGGLRLLIGPLLAVAVLSACGDGPYHGDETPPSPTSDAQSIDAPPEPPAPKLAPLTGEIISEEHRAALEAKRPLAVMIDNLAPAAPQAGIDQADIVIEALVEGGVTRYLAIFHSKDPEVIEPVRSARTPFLQWASEYDALYVHVGSAEKDGPADAGQQIRDWGIYDIDLGTKAFDYSYVRDPKRRAPHNVLVNASQLRAKATELGLEGAPMFLAWPYTSADGLIPGQPAPGITISFGLMSPRFFPRWDWNPETQRYERTQFGAPQFDAASGNRVASANVIVQYADARVVDTSGHVLIDNIGEGRAQVFSNGQLVEGTWRKPDIRARTEFIGADGLPIPLLSGTTWIEVVPYSGGAILN